ncbi:unnamed protein product, partial [marine sediment metagenome]
MENEPISFGKHLQNIRKDRNMSGPKLAKLLAIPYTTYHSYEKDDSFPPIDKLIRIKEVLEISFDYLLYPLLNKKIEDQEFLEIIEFLKKIRSSSEDWRTAKEVIIALYDSIRI